MIPAWMTLVPNFINILFLKVYNLLKGDLFLGKEIFLRMVPFFKLEGDKDDKIEE